VQTESFLKNETLKHTETATECFCLVVDTDKNQENFNSKKLFNVGEYLIEWRRRDLLSDNENEDDNDDSCVCDEEPEARSLFYIRSEVKLPEIKIEAFPFLIEANLPKYGTSDKHVTVVYKIKNKTHYSLIDIECSLDENDFFSISGNKMVKSDWIKRSNYSLNLIFLFIGIYSNTAKFFSRLYFCHLPASNWLLQAP